jgi:hypothetical protein
MLLKVKDILRLPHLGSNSAFPNKVISFIHLRQRNLKGASHIMMHTEALKMIHRTMQVKLVMSQVANGEGRLVMGKEVGMGDNWVAIMRIHLFCTCNSLTVFLAW